MVIRDPEGVKVVCTVLQDCVEWRKPNLLRSYYSYLVGGVPRVYYLAHCAKILSLRKTLGIKRVKNHNISSLV